MIETKEKGEFLLVRATFAYVFYLIVCVCVALLSTLSSKLPRSDTVTT